MRKFYTTLMVLLLSSTVLFADELSDAYNKEYTFLKAQKAELQSRLTKEKAQQAADLAKAKAKAKTSQDAYLNLSETLKAKQEQLAKIKEKIDDKKDNAEITGSVVIQAKSTLETYGIAMDESNQTTDIQRMEQAFSDALALYTKLSSIQTKKGKFYLPNGSIAQGDIVKVGNIAAYGIAQEAAGALAPAGNGEYKLWNAVGSADDAKALFAKEMRPDLNIFVYENLDKEVEYQKEKTMDDTLKAGGVIGYVILALGAFGLLLLLVRVFVLLGAGSSVDKITGIVVEKVKNGEGDSALDAIKNFDGSTARVIKATLRNIRRGREHIEDIIMENILNEQSKIDRFGNFVLVIAAVAPLLGLLGTVTGMIATFDVITEYGTGDPKLLSGGISEALVTTEFGLIVAIPLLLIGNMLSGWAQNIKDSMEHSALHIVNIFQKHSTK
ncbi:MAG: MotA/TolQ/ExbB proton channel family protein [Campylobacterales bacterium]|nr:MotA/TolQ/ExbB proton channel family protein [Campylobacterales bacterium]